jgi:hypothetical protein
MGATRVYAAWRHDTEALLREHGLVTRQACVRYLQRFHDARWCVHGLRELSIANEHPDAYQLAWACARFLGKR